MSTSSKAILALGGAIVAGLIVCVGLVVAINAMPAPSPTPKPYTLADAIRDGKADHIMKDMGYCPGEGLPGLSLRRAREIPPCPVERFLGQRLKDPSSYQGVHRAGQDTCSIRQDDKNRKYLVDCTYRARNSFGAMALHSQRFHVVNNQVTRVDEDAVP